MPEGDDDPGVDDDPDPAVVRDDGCSDKDDDEGASGADMSEGDDDPGVTHEDDFTGKDDDEEPADDKSEDDDPDVDDDSGVVPEYDCTEKKDIDKGDEGTPDDEVSEGDEDPDDEETADDESEDDDLGKDENGSTGFLPPKICFVTRSASTDKLDGLDRWTENVVIFILLKVFFRSLCKGSESLVSSPVSVDDSFRSSFSRVSSSEPLCEPTFFPTSSVPSPLQPPPLSLWGNLMCVTLILFIHVILWLSPAPIGSEDAGSVSFPLPTSGCSLDSAVGSSSELLCLFVPESDPNITAAFFSPVLSAFDASTLDSALSAEMETPGFGFLGTIGAVLKGPGPTFLPPDTTLVVLKRNEPGTVGLRDNVGLSLSLGLVPSRPLIAGLGRPITAAAPLPSPPSTGGSPSSGDDSEPRFLTPTSGSAVTSAVGKVSPGVTCVVAGLL